MQVPQNLITSPASCAFENHFRYPNFAWSLASLDYAGVLEDGQRASSSCSVSTREDCLAASKMRLTTSSVAGMLWRESQYKTLDFPLIGPISTTCSRPKRCAGTPL